MKIPDEFTISDNRNKFNKKTFCGYKKTDVFKILKKSMLEGKLEDALSWSVEMIVSGYIDELWDKIILFICIHINTKNINTITYIFKRYKEYLLLIKNNDFNKKYKLRNNQVFRNHMCEIICILTHSEKEKLFSLKKLKPLEFSLQNINARIKAHKLLNIEIIKTDDPKELKLISNEIIYSMNNFNLPNIIYWISWIIQWEKIVIKKTKKYVCAYRPKKNIDMKYHNDMIWLLWDIIIHKAKQCKFNDEIQCLFHLFKHNYKKSKQNKRLPYMLCSLKFLFFNGTHNTRIIDKNDILIRACININYIYKDKKSYENQTDELCKDKKYNVLYRKDTSSYNRINNQLNKQPYDLSNNKVITEKVKKRKKKSNISESSLKKLEYVMKIGGVIRHDNTHAKKIVHYAKADPHNQIKYINLK